MVTFCITLLENKIDTVASYINFNSMNHDKCEFASNCIQLVMIINLFPLEAEQYCEHCQLWEKSIGEYKVHCFSLRSPATSVID